MQTIETCLYQAIDLELHHRRASYIKRFVEYNRIRIPLGEMSAEMRDSLLAIRPLPKKPAPNRYNYNILELIDSGEIRSVGDIEIYIKQDNMYRSGKAINTHILDSIFDHRLSRNYVNRVSVVNGADSLLSCTGGVLIITTYRN